MIVESPLPRYGLPTRPRRQAMMAVGIAVFMSVLDYSVANVALPSIANDLHVSSSQSIWVINAYQLSALALLFPLSAIGARVGYAKTCCIGIALFLIASIFCATSHSLLQITLARALQGAGGSCIMAVNLALIRFIYPHERIGKGIALNGLIIGLGVASGPSIGSLVLSVASWHWIFWINLPLGALALCLGMISLPKTPLSDSPLNFLALSLSVVALTASVIGIDDLAHGGQIGVVLIGLGLMCGYWLYTVERRERARVIPIDLLPIPDIFLAFCVSGLGFLASNLFIIGLPFSLETVFHRAPTRTGFLITPWALAVGVMSYIIGRWTDRVAASRICAFGLTMTATAFFLLWCLPEDASDWDIAWRVALGGCGFGLFQPPNNRALMVAAPEGREGGASGLVSIARLSGQTVGALLVAAIFRYNGHATMICLLYGAIMAGAAGALSLCRGPIVAQLNESVCRRGAHDI